MNCIPTVINPSSSCNKPEGMVKMIILAKEGVSFASDSAATVKANWDALVQSKDILPIPVAIMSEPSNEGAVYEQTPLGSMFVRDGRQEMKVSIASNHDLHAKIRSINSGNYTKVFWCYTSGIILGTRTAGEETIYPFDLELLHAEYRTENDGSVGGKSPIHMTFADPREYQDYPAILAPSWNIFRLQPLTNVALTVVSASATSIVVDAYVPHANAGFKAPVSGLITVGDWLLTTSAGVVETVGGVTENAQVAGRYTITGTGYVTGFVNLKTPSTMTTKGFESVGAVAKTIA